MNFLDILFPKRCVGCGRLGKYFCDRCRSSIRLIESNEAVCPVCEKPAIDGSTHPRCRTRYTLDGLTSFFRYDGVVRQAIKSIKYRYVSDLASEFISLVPQSSLNGIMKSRDHRVTLVPIPLHPFRLKFRGFNQAELLGDLIGQRVHISMRTDMLKRVRKTTPQVDMKDRDDRLKNMEGVFTIGPVAVADYDKMVLKHRNVISQNIGIFLFDDVFTTGATMRSAANVLKRTGVKSVWGITIAR